jgi:hypothetical protein
MDSESSERKVLIDFIKEIKNTQFNKLNSSSLKSSSIIAFFAASIIFFINGLPSVKPPIIKLYLLLIVFNFLVGSVVVFANIFNAFFRNKEVHANILGEYGELKKQYMRVVATMSILQEYFLIAVNITIIVLMFVVQFAYTYLSLPSIIYLVIIIGMIRSSYIPIINNYQKKDYDYKSGKLDYLFGICNFLGILLMVYYPLLFYCSGVIFDNKKVFIYALYSFGLLISSFYFSRFLSYKIIYSWLERLYTKVHVEDISLEELKARLSQDLESINDLDTVVYNVNKSDASDNEKQ